MPFQWTKDERGSHFDLEHRPGDLVGGAFVTVTPDRHIVLHIDGRAVFDQYEPAYSTMSEGALEHHALAAVQDFSRNLTWGANLWLGPHLSNRDWRQRYGMDHVYQGPFVVVIRHNELGDLEWALMSAWNFPSGSTITAGGFPGNLDISEFRRYAIEASARYLQQASEQLQGKVPNLENNTLDPVLDYQAQKLIVSPNRVHPSQVPPTEYVGPSRFDLLRED